jgi:hypothetical protein
MYCPNCAAQVDGMKFCRQCGANVSLVPQALTGHLPAGQASSASAAPFNHHLSHKNKSARSPSIEGAAREFFTGIGFLFVSLAIWRFFPGGFVWWFWLLIPAFGAMGKGIGQYLSLREQQRMLPPSPQFQPPTALPQAQPQPQFSAPTTSELKLPASAAPPPASVTEHTTALLERERAQGQEPR